MLLVASDMDRGFREYNNKCLLTIESNDERVMMMMLTNELSKGINDLNNHHLSDNLIIPLNLRPIRT